MENSESIYLAVVRCGPSNIIIKSKMKVCPGDVVSIFFEGTEGLAVVEAVLSTEEGSDISVWIEHAVPYIKRRSVTGIWRKDCQND